jgi:molecular chaperone DnaK
LGENGDLILPSVVGLDADGKLLVGRPARNRYVLAPEQTIRSIKRKMGQETTVRLGDRDYTPQEVSAIILRTLKTRAEHALGKPVAKAVITVPAFFNDAQREATREAGELAGLEVVRIINEPTAAVLTYEPQALALERVLVYDLGGGTFDVSIVQMEKGVVEVLASHGDTQLGGDDFDQRLLDFVCDAFLKEHGIDLRESSATRSRFLHAVEEAKKLLSFAPIAALAEEFVAEKDGVPLHLNRELERHEFELLIEPLLAKTLRCVDEALSDAKLNAKQIDKVILVGGATRTPRIARMLEDRLGQPAHLEVEPDLAVAMGAAVQAGLIAGVDVGPILVDITPHSLGIAVLDRSSGVFDKLKFAPIIERNTPLPAGRSEMFFTSYDYQDAADVVVYQGENPEARRNHKVGSFKISGLSAVPAGNEIVVRLDLDLNGILKVTATERMTGLAKDIVIDNAAERFRKTRRADAADRLNAVFESEDVFRGEPIAEGEVLAPTDESAIPLDEDVLKRHDAATVAKAKAVLAKSTALRKAAPPEDAETLATLSGRLQTALVSGGKEETAGVLSELEDLVFYLEDA